MLQFPLTTSEQSKPADGGLFETLVFKSLNDAATKERAVHQIVAEGAESGDMNMTEAVLAMKEADAAMRMILQVRMKLVDAWNELKNMQV